MRKEYKYSTKEEIWITSKEKPTTYKLVKVRHENDSIHTGWWTGFMWDGLKIESKHVVAWKKVSYNNSPTKAYLGD